MDKKWIETPRGKVFYWSEGNPAHPCCLLLHGALLDHRMFFQQATFLREDFYLIMPDLPGHGQSRSYDQNSFPNAIEDLLAILEQEKVHRTHLLGHSMGGFIAQEFYRQSPDTVISLICAGSAPLAGKYYTQWDRLLFKLAPWVLKLIPKQQIIQLMAARGTLTPSASHYVKDTMAQYTHEEMVEMMVMLAQNLQFGEPFDILCPFLIIVGDSDDAGRAQVYSQQWAEETSAALVEIPLAAHLLNVDNPGSFNLILQSWLTDPS